MKGNPIRITGNASSLGTIARQMLFDVLKFLSVRRELLPVFVTSDYLALVLSVILDLTFFQGRRYRWQLLLDSILVNLLDIILFLRFKHLIIFLWIYRVHSLQH